MFESLVAAWFERKTAVQSGSAIRAWCLQEVLQSGVDRVLDQEDEIS